MKTRSRKSRAGIAVGDDATASSPVAEGSSAGALSLNLPDDLDVGYLTSLLPDITLDAPRSDDVVLLYQIIVARDSELETARRELEQSQAELQKQSIELDQALQDRESSGKEVEKELSTALEELKITKKERDELCGSSANTSLSWDCLTSCSGYKT